jgi:hypothetical protein
MPIIFTDFIVRQPRVSVVNHPNTLPPQSSGTWGLQNAFTIKYTGAATTAVLIVTAKEILTLINNNRSHADNLNIVLSGQLLSDVMTALAAFPNYTVSLQGAPGDRALLSGFQATNILNTDRTVIYGKPAEFLVQAESTAKLGSVTVNYLKNAFSYSQTDRIWKYNPATVPTATNLLVPVNGVRFIENGANIVFTPNPDSTFDMAYLKTETDQVLINNAQANTQFINFAVLPSMVPNSLSLVINGTPAVEDVNYQLSYPDKRINFLKGVTNESHLLSVDSSSVDTNIQGIGGVITDSISVKRNGNPLTRNVDFVPRVTTQYQDEDVGPGTIFFTKTYVDDAIAEYVLGVELSLLASDFIVKVNGVSLLAAEYVVVFEAGFLNLNTRCFPGDVVTVTYRSKKFGSITDEIVAGTAGAITGITQEPFEIVAGVNDSFSVLVDNTFIENIILPVGSNVGFSDVISAYNSQTSFSLLTTSTDGLHLLVASRSGGPSSQIKILAGNANATLGFTSGQTSSGTGAVGGEFAFTLANAPVEVTSFSVPEGGDTFILRENNVAVDYPSGAIVKINAGLYIVDSTSTTDEAFLYSANPSTPELPTFRIAADTNDIFIFSVDGTEHTVILTEGEVLTQDIVDDINLIAGNVASAVLFNGTTKIKLASPTLGIGGSVVIGNGTANQTLGFSAGAKDSGLTDTIVKIVGGFNVPYINPILYTTRTPVTFITETAQQEKTSLGVSSIFFNGVDVTAHYTQDVVLRINDALYTVVGSAFANNKTEVKVSTPLQDHLFTTDVISYTNRPVFTAGATVLSLTKAPILDLPIIVKDNGSTLTVDTDYTVSNDGRIRLVQPLTPSRSITATYTVFDNFPAGDLISLSYRFFSSVNEGSVVTGSYQYTSADQFFFDVVFQDALADVLIDKVKSDAQRAINPASSGFAVGAGAGNANSDGGSETPKLTEYKSRYDDAIAKKVFDFYDARCKGFTDERKYYDGTIVGAVDGPVTEANIQDVINNPTRLFPANYTPTEPLRVPALDGVGLSDSGSGTGGVDVSQIITTYTSAESTDITNETTYINQILAIPTGTGPVSLTGTAVITTVLFYDGTGINPKNNVFSFDVNGVTKTVTFTASSAGTSTTLTTILSQINAVSASTAFNSSSRVQLQASSGLLIGNPTGSANTVLGFTAGQTSTTREGSAAYASWRALVQDEINQQTTELARLNSTAAALTIQLQEWVTPYDQSFDEAKARLVVVQQFITDTTSSQTQNTTDYNMNVQINSNLTNRRDVTNPARQTKISTFAGTITARKAQITASLSREGLFDKRYSWLRFRALRTTGTIVSIQRAVQNQIDAANEAAHAKTLIGAL